MTTIKKERLRCLKEFRKMGLDFKTSTKIISLKKRMGDFHLPKPMESHWPHEYAEILAGEGYEIVALTNCSYDDLDFSNTIYFAGYMPHDFEESWLIVKKNGQEIKIPANDLSGKYFNI